eukprot:2656068-Rhodomonas_salina.5
MVSRYHGLAYTITIETTAATTDNLPSRAGADSGRRRPGLPLRHTPTQSCHLAWWLAPRPLP